MSSSITTLERVYLAISLLMKLVEIARVVLSSRFNNKHRFTKKTIYILTFSKIKFGQRSSKSTTMGFEPTTFGSEVQRANPLRYAVLHV